MSRLNAEQKTVENFLGDRKNFFLIPDYQRPYAWEDEECIKLWDDILAFSFPNNDWTEFRDDDDYFLGSLVLFKNEHGIFEVIDGHQRLITLTLMLRAFYQAYGDRMTDEDSHDAKRDIAKCLWKTPPSGSLPDMSKLKIISEVITEGENEEFLHIMLTGEAEKKHKSRYAKNYRLFQRQIKKFLEDYPSYFPFMPERILVNCSMLPIEAESQDTALRIFSTLNDRGKPLSDSDIFKAKLYKAYSDNGKKDWFIQKWKEFENTCGKISVLGKSNPIDDIFMRYMHCLRASKGVRDTTVDALRDFYGRDDTKFSPLKRDYTQTFSNLIILADFWKDITALDRDRFSERVCKSLFILHYVPNNIWTFLVSVYFMTNKSADKTLDDENFYNFLQKIIGFFLASRIIRPVNPTPFFNAMADVANGRDASFIGYKFDPEELRSRMLGFDFNDSKKITRGIIAWYVFQDERQEVLSLETHFDTEHIYPRARREREGLIDAKNFESLGNKSLLEKNINIRASDYRFQDKTKYYLGTPEKAGTKINELKELAQTREDFTERDIIERNKKIINSFINFIKANNLTI
ncbi:MAG: DUF262 domain-containing protein [Synergistaceae bacterium]|nr:DUF262 domain-containing protein [Synergistaceae bacterium]